MLNWGKSKYLWAEEKENYEFQFCNMAKVSSWSLTQSEVESFQYSGQTPVHSL